MHALRPPSRRLSAATIVCLAVCSGAATASAQPTSALIGSTSALIEDWRHSDLGFVARMMVADANGDL
jgi:hypothetical protein